MDDLPQYTVFQNKPPIRVSRHGSFESEMAFAVARGRMPVDLAHISILARHREIDEAHRQAEAFHRAVRSFTHLREQLMSRVRDEAEYLVKCREPKNIILARSHDINQDQWLDEGEVNEVVLAVIWESLPEPARSRRRGR